MFNQTNISIGISPINWNNEDILLDLSSEASFEQILSETVLTGYSGIEFGIDFPRDATLLKRHLNLRKIKIPSKWFGCNLSLLPFDTVIQQFTQDLQLLTQINADCINVCDMSNNHFRSDYSMFINKPMLTTTQWDYLCKLLDYMGRLAAGYNIKLCYHPHIGTVVETAEEIQYLLDHTRPAYVNLCIDTADMILADIEPVAFIHEYGTRIKHVHLKDIYAEKLSSATMRRYSFREAIKSNCFTVPGDGNGHIDFQEIFIALDQIAYAGWLIVEAEQNPQLTDPFASALQARYFLTAMLDL